MSNALPAQRLITVSIAGQPDFLFDAMQGTDSMSELSDYTVRLLHRSLQVDVQSLLGQSLTLTIQTAAAPRYINGVIARVALIGQEGEVDRYFVYEATVVPWFWLATHKKDFRIYQNQSVPEIIRQVLAPYGYAFEFDLVENYKPRVYCVQYDETDFQFVSRLLEAEGVHYYFRHEQNQHTLVMSDDMARHRCVDGYEQVSYFTEDKLTLPQQDYMTHLTVCQELRPGQYATNDYDFTKPKVDLAASQRSAPGHDDQQGEVYEWPGNYADDPLGERYARQRMQEQHHARDIKTLRSTARGVATGTLFSLMRCPRTEENRQYVVLSTRYDLHENNYHSVASPEQATQNGRRCVFDLTVQCATLPFRPPRTTRKPRTQGPQTAVVVGPEGEEIWADEYGRVKVHFHWDRYDNKDENSSCWIRVASSWASSNFGAIQVPRIGDEVIVDFINGDPDYPMITGRVYNAANMPPWTLPENATQMGFYSRSTPDGDYHTANAIRFEDKKGQEQLWIHAERNQDTEVENDETHWVGRDRSTTILQDDTLIVRHNRVESIEHDHTETVGQDVRYEVGRNRQEKIGKDFIHRVGNHRIQTTYADHVEEDGGSVEKTVKGHYTLDVSQNITNNARTHTLQGFERMVIKAPGGTITIDRASITLDSPTIYLKGHVVHGEGHTTQVPVLAAAANAGLPLCEECEAAAAASEQKAEAPE